jgi:hypothetical protein
VRRPLGVYLLERTDEPVLLDYYDAAVVVAATVDQAKTLAAEILFWPTSDQWPRDPDLVVVRRVGSASAKQKPGVVLSSFQAG